MFTPKTLKYIGASVKELTDGSVSSESAAATMKTLAAAQDDLNAAIKKINSVRDKLTQEGASTGDANKVITALSKAVSRILGDSSSAHYQIVEAYNVLQDYKK